MVDAVETPKIWQDMNTSQKLAFCKANAAASYATIAKRAGATHGAVHQFFMAYGIPKGRNPGGRVPEYDRAEFIEKAATLWPMYHSQAQVGKALKLKEDTFKTIIDFARRNGDKRFPPHRRGRDHGTVAPYEMGGAGAFEPRSKPLEDVRDAFLKEKPTLEAVHAAFAPNRALTPPRSVRFNAYQHAQLRNLRCAAR